MLEIDQLDPDQRKTVDRVSQEMEFAMRVFNNPNKYTLADCEKAAAIVSNHKQQLISAVELAIVPENLAERIFMGVFHHTGIKLPLEPKYPNHRN